MYLARLENTTGLLCTYPLHVDLQLTPERPRAWQWHGGRGGYSAVGTSPADARVRLLEFRSQFQPKRIVQ